MKTRLLNGIEKLEADEVEREYLSSSRLRKRIRDLLQKDVDSIHMSMREEESYNNPSWPYLQSQKLGEVKAILKLISLLE